MFRTLRNLAMSIQELERRWRSEPENEELLSELLRLYERSNLEIPLDILASTPRWRRLSWLLATFYEEPIGVAGNTIEEIRDKEAELGFTLPKALREWYRLVGNRLDSCERSEPAKLSYLELIVNDVRLEGEKSSAGILPDDSETLEIYSEALSHWVAVICRENFGEEDPVVFVCDATLTVDSVNDGPIRFENVSQFLIGMMFEEILAVASGGAGVGALGLLRNGLRAGQDERQPNTLKAGYERCFTFEWGLWELGEECFYSDRETLFSLSSTSSLRWICSSEMAYERLRALGRLEEEEVYVLFFQWPDLSGDMKQSQREKLEAGWDLLSPRLCESSEREMWPDDRFKIRTSNPSKDFESAKAALLAEMPELLEDLEVAYRLVNRGHWKILWPPGLKRFTRREMVEDEIPF